MIKDLINIDGLLNQLSQDYQSSDSSSKKWFPQNYSALIGEAGEKLHRLLKDVHEDEDTKTDIVESPVIVENLSGSFAPTEMGRIENRGPICNLWYKTTATADLLFSPEAEEITRNNIDANENMTIVGFLPLKRYLNEVNQHYPVQTMIIRNEDQNLDSTGISFIHRNIPKSGWKKELILRFNGKAKSRIDVQYIDPSRSKRLRTKQEVQTYMDLDEDSSLSIDDFDFRNVFCVCQSPEDPYRNFLECSYVRLRSYH